MDSFKIPWVVTISQRENFDHFGEGHFSVHWWQANWRNYIRRAVNRIEAYRFKIQRYSKKSLFVM